MRLLIVGGIGGTNVGDSLAVAAEAMEIAVKVVETRLAYGGPRLWRTLNWRLGRPSTPGRLDHAVRSVVECDHPDLLLVTGVNPLRAQVIDAARRAGIKAINYLTDDPWNPAHRSEGFLRALPHYSAIFTPRRANIDDLHKAGVGVVEYLPFGYDRRHTVPASNSEGNPADLLFVGGADDDRLPLIARLVQAGVAVQLIGSYWERYTSTRPLTRGQLPPTVVSAATAAAKVNLILVRRANRDGHVMRSFEAAACGGCLLVEETDEHREIFGDTVTYFGTADEMVRQARALLADPERRRASADASYRRIVIDGKNTYADRLRTILDTLGLK